MVSVFVVVVRSGEQPGGGISAGAVSGKGGLKGFADAFDGVRGSFRRKKWFVVVKTRSASSHIGLRVNDSLVDQI